MKDYLMHVDIMRNVKKVLDENLIVKKLLGKIRHIL
jgi:hypothetical protein